MMMLKVIRTIAKNRKAIFLVPNSTINAEMHDFAQSVSFTGIAHYKNNSELSSIELDTLQNASPMVPNNSGIDYASLHPQIAAQLLAGKKPNPTMDIVGTWPGDETDEEFEQMMKELD